jgi:alpha-tubulin suppressor-like RCC1 family protein
MALKTDGTLWSWGQNNSGQLGNGDRLNTSSPVQVGGYTDDWSLVGAGSYHAMALKTNGTMWTWGKNDQGQLGFDDIVNRSDPTQVGALTTWSKVAAGRDHSLAIKTDGTVWSWGNNTHGRLGVGNTLNRSSPVQVGALTTWSLISGGWYNSMAMTARSF